jgi:hypothetical protein
MQADSERPNRRVDFDNDLESCCRESQIVSVWYENVWHEKELADLLDQVHGSDTYHSIQNSSSSFFFGLLRRKRTKKYHNPIVMAVKITVTTT